MKHVYNLFKKYLPIVITISGIAFAFGLLTLLYYFKSSTVSIEFRNVIPIFTLIFIIVAIFFSISFASKVNKLHITKIKKSFGLCKFASLLAATMATALFFFDFFRFVLKPAQFSTLRILRLVVFIPFIIYIVLNVIPKKIKRKPVELPTWLKPLSAFSAIIWCILGLLMIYFWQELPTSNIFKLIIMFYYIILVLFFMFEIKFELFVPYVKGYIFTALLLFIYSFAVIGPLMLAKFFGRLSAVSITEFEIFLAFSLGIYALSKLVAMQQTMNFVMKRSDSSHGHSHHHHNHTDKPADDNATTENVTENTTENK